MSGLKKLLAVSFSVFLLAVSFALVTGRFSLPGEARAQTGTQFVGMFGDTFGNDGYAHCVALSQDGGLYGFKLTGLSDIYGPESWTLHGPVYLGSIAAGGPVPAANTSVGDLKSKFGDKK